MKKVIQFIIFGFILYSKSLPVFSQFAGGCGSSNFTATKRTCSPTECPANAGSYLQTSISANNGGSLFPCPGSTITYTSSVKYTGTTTLHSGSYTVTIQIEPSAYIKNLVLPAVPTDFTGPSANVTINFPLGIPASTLNYPGYTKLLGAEEYILITYSTSRTSASPVPKTQYTLPVSFEMASDAPENIGVGISLYAGLSGRTNLPANQACQTSTLSYIEPMRCSFDPNEIVAFPKGCGDNHLIPKDEKITYFLHFQNTGSAPAISVVLIDTLSKNLDINTLEVLQGSHPFVYRMYPGNVLVFFFDPIYLPDSTADEPKSHGFVSFKISPKPTVKPGDIIKGKTDIYFDNNDGVATNTVTHIIQDEVPKIVGIANKVRTICQGQTNPEILTASQANQYLWNTGATTQSISVTTPGTYYVTAGFNNTCEKSTDTAKIFQYSGALVTQINGPVSVGTSQQGAIFAVSNPDNSSFTWNVPIGATIVSGQGTNMMIVYFNNYTGGKISVIKSNCGIIQPSFSKNLPVKNIGPVLRLNAGAREVVNSIGTFETDGANDTYYNAVDIANTTDDELYRSERFGNNWPGKITYNFRVTIGDYTVKLHFAEIYFIAPGDAGKRKFDVKIENDEVLTDFDILAEVGPKAAIVKSFNTSVMDGYLTINFIPKADRPKISAIEILNDSGVPLYRINAGGPQVETPTGIFIADNYFAPPTSGTYTNYSTFDVLGTEDDAMYKSERFAFPDKGGFNYAVPVTNGNYIVKLHFAEIYYGAIGGKPGGVGTRIFNVKIEESTVLQNYDIFAEVGAMAATAKTMEATVTDGVLDIDFISVVDNAKVSAIEVYSKLSNGQSHLRTMKEEETEKTIAEDVDFLVYPNPVKDKLYVESKNEFEFSTDLLNAFGKILLSKTSEKGGKIAELDIKGLYLQPGIYYARVKSKEGVRVIKLMINQ